MTESTAHSRLVEFGAWEKLRTAQGTQLVLHPWQSPEQLGVNRCGIEAELSPSERSRRARRRLMQAMLDHGHARNRADLACMLGLSRARVSQILGPASKS